MLRFLLSASSLMAPLFCLAAQEPTQKSLWPAMPAAVSSLGAVASDGYLYAYGGHAGKTHSYDTKTVLGSFHRIKLDGGQAWEALPGGPILQGMNLVAWKGKIIRVGGMSPQNAPGEPTNNISLKSVSSYDPVTQKWADLPDLPAGRSSHDVVVVGDQLVVVGGWNQLGKERPIWHDSALTLNLAETGAKWKSIPQPFQRRALTAAVVNDKVYVIAGLDVKAEPSQEVQILEIKTGQWSTGPEMPGEGRVGFSPAATVVDNKIIVSTSDGQVHRLNPAAKNWEKLEPTKTKRMVHRLVPHQKGFILVGGASKGGNVADLEFIDLK
ncbi:MAG: Kelch repeat-containing protein [Fimbriiglobus sp.]